METLLWATTKFAPRRTLNEPSVVPPDKLILQYDTAGSATSQDPGRTLDAERVDECWHCTTPSNGRSHVTNLCERQYLVSRALVGRIDSHHPINLVLFHVKSCREFCGHRGYAT